MANTASTWQYVVVTGPLRGLRDAFCHVKSALLYCRVSYVVVTRIPSLVLRNTWHYVILRYSFVELPKLVLRCSYEAALRRCDHGIKNRQDESNVTKVRKCVRKEFNEGNDYCLIILLAFFKFSWIWNYANTLSSLLFLITITSRRQCPKTGLVCLTPTWSGYWQLVIPKVRYSMDVLHMDYHPFPNEC